MIKISVTKKQVNTFEVEIIEDNSSTKHVVVVKDDDYERLTNKKISREELVRRSFEFLLEREPKESILSFFDLAVIQKYFPEYESTIKV